MFLQSTLNRYNHQALPQGTYHYLFIISNQDYALPVIVFVAVAIASVVTVCVHIIDDVT
jgi:hypothetical protein